MSHYLIKRKFSAPVDRTEVAEDWLNRGFGCDLFVDPPGQEWNNFVHKTHELVTVVEGRLELNLLGVSCVIDIGDEIFIPRGAIHSVKNIHNGVSRWLFGYNNLN